MNPSRNYVDFAKFELHETDVVFYRATKEPPDLVLRQISSAMKTANPNWFGVLVWIPPSVSIEKLPASKLRSIHRKVIEKLGEEAFWTLDQVQRGSQKMILNAVQTAIDKIAAYVREKSGNDALAQDIERLGFLPKPPGVPETPPAPEAASEPVTPVDLLSPAG